MEKTTRLFKESIDNNDYSQIQHLLVQTDPNLIRITYICDDSLTPLDYSIQLKNKEIAMLLIKDNRCDVSNKNYICFRNAASNGMIEIVKILLKKKSVMPNANDNFALLWAMKNKHVKIVKLLLEDERVDPSFKENHCFIWACENGYEEIVQLFLKCDKINPADRKNIAIIKASNMGHSSIVKLLIKDKRIDPSVLNNLLFRLECKNGNLDNVKKLLNDDRINPSDSNSSAFFLACAEGHLEIAKLLLNDKRINPFANNNEALLHSISNEKVEVAKLLINDNRAELNSSINKLLKKAAEVMIPSLVKELLLKTKDIVYENVDVLYLIENHSSVIKKVLADEQFLLSLPSSFVDKIQKCYYDLILKERLEIYCSNKQECYIRELLLKNKIVNLYIDLDEFMKNKFFKKVMKKLKMKKEANNYNSMSMELKRKVEISLNPKIKYDGNIFDAKGNGKVYETKKSLLQRRKSLIFSGSFSFGMKDGVGKLYYPNSTKIEYNGEFKNDQKEGIGKHFSKNGKNIIIGEWKNDKLIKKYNSINDINDQKIKSLLSY